MNRVVVDIRVKEFRASSAARRHRALEQVRLEIGNGEFICVIGPSGCGKTTLLNIVAGLDTDFDGTVTREPGLTLGFVFQTPRLLPWRTVMENIVLALPHRSRNQVVTELLAETRLEDFANAYPNRLSLGMQRRVALVRAFAVSPSLLLMDEPFVSLDQAIAERLREAMLALLSHHPAAVLFVTHDVLEAVRLGTRVIVLSAAPGRILADIALRSPRAARDEREIARLREQVLAAQEQ